MKKLLFVLVILISFSSFTQSTNTSINAYSNFKEGTTYFIKSGNSDFDSAISTIFNNYWNINKWKLISKDEIKTHRGESSFFMDLFEYSYTRTGVDMSYTVKKMMLCKDLEIKKKNIEPLGSLVITEIDEINLPELIYSIQLIQSQISFVLDLNKKKALDFKDMLEEINDRKKNRIKEKTLYFLPNDLKSKINSKEELDKIYDYKYSFVTKEEIETAIIEQNEDVVYSKIISFGSLRFVLFIQAKDSELLYGRVMTGFNQLYIGPKFIKDLND